MPEIKIRRATPADRAKANQVEKEATPHLQYLDNVYDDWLSDNTGRLLVAEIAGKMVGTGKFTVLPDGSAWLETLRVSPDFQGMGIGKTFYRKFFDLAAERKIRTLRMYTEEYNSASKGLAELNGFRLAAKFRGSSIPVPAIDTDEESASFIPVTDPDEAFSLLKPYADRWENFLVMNRTFYRFSEPLLAKWSGCNMIYKHPASGTLVILGARFLPERGLQLALFAGDADRALDFALQQTRLQGINRLQCMFPEAADGIRQKLIARGFTPEDYYCQVMEYNR